MDGRSCSNVSEYEISVSLLRARAVDESNPFRRESLIQTSVHVALVSPALIHSDKKSSLFQISVLTTSHALLKLI